MPEPTRAPDYADKIAAEVQLQFVEIGLIDACDPEATSHYGAACAREGYKLAMGLAVNA